MLPLENWSSVTFFKLRKIGIRKKLKKKKCKELVLSFLELNKSNLQCLP